MGVHLSHVNHDREFATHSGKTPIIINDVSAFSEEDLDRLNKLIYTTFSGDLLSNIPSCDCGDITGEYNLGVLCPKCKTRVESVLEQDLEPLTWLRAPKGVAGLINPIIWTKLSNHFKVGSFNFIQWLCDTKYESTYRQQLSASIANILQQIELLGIQRGLNNFVHNFDSTIQKLFTIKQFKAQKEPLQQILSEQRDKVFSQYLPVPHRSLLVVEETNHSAYVDPISTGAIDAIRTLAGIDTELAVHSVRTKENRTTKAIAEISKFYENTYRDLFAAKEGIFRKHVFATRSHFSFRAVVSSITNKHYYDQIQIPWGIATSVFRIHLMNKLMKLGYSPVEGVTLINACASVYHPLLDKLFKEIIAEAPSGKGVNCSLNRNPSLARGSIQSVYISEVKTDPNIPTVSMSILIVRSLNADFDGRVLPSLKPVNCWKLLKID